MNEKKLPSAAAFVCAFALASSGCAAASARNPFDPVVMERRLACLSYESASDIQSILALPRDDSLGADPLAPPEPEESEPKVVPPPPEPGRRSDLMDQATKLYDAGDWKGAVPVLQRVVRREGQDDEGNLELALYELGVSYYRSGAFDLALRTFAPIAADKRQLMHHEALYWIVDLVLEEETNLGAIDLAFQYVGENYFELDSTNRELEYLLQYIWARGYYRAGNHGDAIRKMEAVARDPRFTRIANDCASLARQASSHD